MKKVCSICKTPFETKTEDEMKAHFYFKSGYFMNNCIKCELEKHKKKYKEGKYNYNKFRDDGYDIRHILGNFNRCYNIPIYDNNPFF